jgi:hypothetical protein
MGGRNNRKNKNRKPREDWEEKFLISTCNTLNMMAFARGDMEVGRYKQTLRTLIQNGIVENKGALGIIDTDPEVPDDWMSIQLAWLVSKPGMTVAKFRKAAAALRKVALNASSGTGGASGSSSTDLTTGSYQPAEEGGWVDIIEDIIPDDKAGPSEQKGEENQWWDPFDWF